MYIYFFHCTSSFLFLGGSGRGSTLGRGAYHVLFRIARLPLVLTCNSALTCGSQSCKHARAATPRATALTSRLNQDAGSRWVSNPRGMRSWSVRPIACEDWFPAEWAEEIPCGFNRSRRRCQQVPWSASEHGRDTKKSWACTAAWQSPAVTVHCATGTRPPPAERVESLQCNGFSTIKHSRTSPLCTSSSDRRTTKLSLHVSLVLSGRGQSFSLLARFPMCQMFDSRIVSINSLIVASLRNTMSHYWSNKQQCKGINKSMWTD